MWARATALQDIFDFEPTSNNTNSISHNQWGDFTSFPFSVVTSTTRDETAEIIIGQSLEENEALRIIEEQFAQELADIDLAISTELQNPNRSWTPGGLIWELFAQEKAVKIKMRSLQEATLNEIRWDDDLSDLDIKGLIARVSTEVSNF